LVAAQYVDIQSDSIVVCAITGDIGVQRVLNSKTSRVILSDIIFEPIVHSVQEDDAATQVAFSDITCDTIVRAAFNGGATYPIIFDVVFNNAIVVGFNEDDSPPTDAGVYSIVAGVVACDIAISETDEEDAVLMVVSRIVFSDFIISRIAF